MKAKSIIVSLLVTVVTCSLMGQGSGLNVWTPETVVLFRGIENPVQVSLNGASKSDLLITVSDGAILKENGKRLSVFVPGKYEKSTVEIKVQSKSDKEQKLPVLYVFKVKDIPVPEVSLGNLDPKKHSFSKEEILNNLSFTVRTSDYFPYKVNYTVKSYEFSIVIKGVTNAITFKGDKIGETIIEYIKNADEPVQKIAFFNIILEGPDGTTVKTAFGVDIFNGWKEKTEN